jgi:hypothetical protein
MISDAGTGFDLFFAISGIFPAYLAVLAIYVVVMEAFERGSPSGNLGRY